MKIKTITMMHVKDRK